MMRRLTSVWTAAVVLTVVAQVTAQQKPTVDVTGAWTVTITRSSGGSVSGLAILSQDGDKITAMIGPAETEMMPAEGTVDGNKVTLLTRPRTGRTAAFAKGELTATVDKMTGTIDTDKGAIELIRKQRPKPGQPAK
jgi:Spy/CpxP family protein refolding chaperone